MQIKQLENLLSIEEEGQKRDTKSGESMVHLSFACLSKKIICMMFTSA